MKQQSSCLLQACRVKGSLYMDSKAWETMQTVHNTTAEENTFIAADAPIYWPFECGPFEHKATH